MLGLNVHDAVRSYRDGEKENIKYVELEVERKVRDVVGDEKIDITSLECDVLSSNLVIIRVICNFSGDNTNEKPYTEIITYSSSFTIWWDEVE